MTVERPCPPPPPDYPEYWPRPEYFNHGSLCEWWEYYLAFLAGWAYWASTDNGGFIQ